MVIYIFRLLRLQFKSVYDDWPVSPSGLEEDLKCCFPHFNFYISLPSDFSLPLHRLLPRLKLFINKLSSFFLLLVWLYTLSLWPTPTLCFPLSSSLSFFLPSFLSSSLVPLASHHPSHLSIRSWRSVSAIITTQSCSLSERLTARASRRSNSSRSKSCRRSALNWRTRAKPCWVRPVCLCVCVVCVETCIKKIQPHMTLWHIFFVNKITLGCTDLGFWSQCAPNSLWKLKKVLSCR